jgi:hypothetical protein
VLARSGAPEYLDAFVELLSQIAEPPASGAGLRVSALGD